MLDTYYFSTLWSGFVPHRDKWISSFLFWMCYIVDLLMQNSWPSIHYKLMSLPFLKQFNYLLYCKIKLQPFLPTAQASSLLHILRSNNSKLLVVPGCLHQPLSCRSAFTQEISAWKCFSHPSFHFLLANSSNSSRLSSCMTYWMSLPWPFPLFSVSMMPCPYSYHGIAGWIWKLYIRVHFCMSSFRPQFF